MTMRDSYSLVEGAQRLRYLRQLEAMAQAPKARQKKAIMARARRRRVRRHAGALLAGLLVGLVIGAVLAP